MDNFKRVMAATIGAATLAALPVTGFASSSDGASYRLELRGVVPVICRASVSSNVVKLQEGRTDLGAMREFCNSGNGYQVWLDHSASAQGAAYVDGQRIPLASTGSTLISQSATAARRDRELAIELAEASSANIAVRVVAL
jgi:hypothetical protein